MNDRQCHRFASPDDGVDGDNPRFNSSFGWAEREILREKNVFFEWRKYDLIYKTSIMINWLLHIYCTSAAFAAHVFVATEKWREREETKNKNKI